MLVGRCCYTEQALPSTLGHDLTWNEREFSLKGELLSEGTGRNEQTAAGQQQAGEKRWDEKGREKEES